MAKPESVAILSFVPHIFKHFEHAWCFNPELHNYAVCMYMYLIRNFNGEVIESTTVHIMFVISKMIEPQQLETTQ